MPTLGKVLLADDSPHAQRMGERILREEGYDVITVTDGETAIMRIKDVDPDVVIVDAFLPQVSGYDLCGYIKKQQQYSHVRVLLTSTALEKVDEDQAYKVGADGQLKKPFEASVMLKSLKDLIGGSEKDKKKRAGTTLDLNGPVEAASEKDDKGADEETAAERPVSALQAWLQQHDTDAAQEREAEEKSAAPEVPAAEAEAGGMEEIRNPQLLRKPEQETEDLTLRNNPVARLRQKQFGAGEEQADRGAKDEEREEEPAAASRGVRTFRMPSTERPEGGESEGEPRPVATPKRSLLEALEEFERASQVEEAGAEEEEAVAASEAPVVEEAEESEPVSEEAAELETIEEVAVTEVEPADEEEEAEPVAEVAELGYPEEPAEDAEADETPEVPEEPEPVIPALMQVAEAATVSLSEANVRLDEEEIRAAVEIAVSASMPTIVDEVTRCVVLALEARYQHSRELEAVEEPR